MLQDLTLVKGDTFDIAVYVANPQEIKSTISSYTAYTLTGEDQQGSFEVIRRYSDFNALRVLLLERWPGCFIPPLPPKKLVGKGEALFVEERRRQLEVFMQKVAKLKHLWYSTEFQLFVKSPGSDTEKALKALPAQSEDELAKKYDEVITKLSGKEINTMILAKISGFSTYIRKVHPIIHNLKEMVANYIDLRCKHHDQFVAALSYLMPEFETNCLAEYVNYSVDGKYIFAESKDEKLGQLILKLKNFAARTEILDLYHSLELEEREIEAFMDVFKQKENYEGKLEDFRQREKDLNIEYSKLMAGKQGFFKSLLKGNIEENKRQVQRDIERVKMEKENYVFVCDISTVILGHFEIDRFKQEKSGTYFRALLKVGECESEFTALKSQIFEHVLQNHNLV